MRTLDFALPLGYFNDLGRPSLAPREEFNASNRGIREPFVRRCGRAVPRGFFLSRLGHKGNSALRKRLEYLFDHGHQFDAQTFSQGDKLAVISRTLAVANQLHHFSRMHVELESLQQGFSLGLFALSSSSSMPIVRGMVYE
ncbi:hypothetical protein SDC9_206799 [bioreactor metagenome]|uniref:Uncharacterized protein n=1 Tax=bioreactor metagenome TaxID=1076179 RepID=A0A645J636_9ZZZZ